MTTTDDQTRRDPAELDTIREQCGALELALERETDPAAAAELRRELAEREGQQPENTIQAGGDRERQIIHPDIAARIEEINEAHRTGVYMSGGLYGDPESIAAFEARTMPEATQALDAGLAELAEQHEARLMERDESFSGEVVAEIEREDDSRAYVGSSQKTENKAR